MVLVLNPKALTLLLERHYQAANPITLLIRIYMNLFKSVEGLKAESLFIDDESLTVSFGPYRIVIYSSYLIQKPEGLIDIPKASLNELLIEDEAAKFIFSNGCIITVNLSADGYNGPEAMVLYDTEKPLAIWS